MTDMTNMTLTETLPVRETPAGAFDATKYARYVDELDLTVEQQEEVLRALWTIMTSFVDMGFGVESVQTFIPALRKLSSEFQENALDVAAAKRTAEFNDAAGQQKDDEP